MLSVCPKLIIAKVEKNPDDLAYERGALETMDYLGIQTHVAALPDNISRQDFINAQRQTRTALLTGY